MIVLQCYKCGGDTEKTNRVKKPVCFKCKRQYVIDRNMANKSSGKGVQLKRRSLKIEEKSDMIK